MFWNILGFLRGKFTIVWKMPSRIERMRGGKKQRGDRGMKCLHKTVDLAVQWLVLELQVENKMIDMSIRQKNPKHQTNRRV